MKETVRPPHLFTQCFKWFCSSDYYEELQGDLEQAFYRDVERVGLKKARTAYKKEVMLMFRPSVIKRFKTRLLKNNNIDMIRNYMKIAFRSMVAQKAYAFINIFGLAIGMAATILISLYVHNELSYDRYHDKADRVYRLSRQWFNDNGESNLHLGHVAPPFGPLLQSDFEGIIQHAVRFVSGNGPLMVHEDKKFQEEGFFFAENDIFQVFSWQFLHGDPKTALEEPNGIVLTETAARRYFGDKDPMNSSIVFNNFGQQVEMKVTAIIEDTPDNSHFKFTMLASFKLVENFFGRENMMNMWGNNSFSTYILLNEGRSTAELSAGFPAFLDKHLKPDANGIPASVSNKLHLTPLTDIHLYSHLDSEIEANGNAKYIYAYSIIAAFILVIASINFMNLSTARSMKRAKEVGMRKVMGAYRGSLIGQFITESIVMALLAAFMAIWFVVLILPWFNNFADKELTLLAIDPVFLAGLLLAVVLAVGLLAGSYPAFYLSAFRPVRVLKGALRYDGKANLRSGLVVFQFFISICLIIGVGVIGDQINYMKTKDLGFNKEQMVILPAPAEIEGKFELVKNRLMEHSGIENVTLSNRVPSGRLLDAWTGQAEVNGEMKNIEFRIAGVFVDHDYLNMLDVKFLAGRNFDAQLASDSTEAFILNKVTIDRLGWESPEKAIGQKFNYGARSGYIIGIVDDFHFESLHQPIAPIAFSIISENSRNVMVKVKADQKEHALAHLEEEWNNLRPGFLFDYTMVSDQFDQQYEAEEKLGELVSYFSWLAIFVAILGLFGLSSFSIEQRIKEIGIRKVLGASVSSVLFMFTKRFAILVIIGLVMAVPVSYYGMQTWLSTFPYQAAINPLTFMIGGMVALGLAVATISYETIKAAIANPVDTLRSE
ncbi:MAG: ABC transporter permease [Bacteroidota bacterium]